MTDDILAFIDKEYQKFPVLMAGPPSHQAIDKIESYVGFKLPSSYKEFVSRFGAGIVGSYPVYGLGLSEAMGACESSAITVTKRFRADGWPGTHETLVISMDHAGNAITLNKDGRIHLYDHDLGNAEQIAASFEAFLSGFCLGLLR